MNEKDAVDFLKKILSIPTVNGRDREADLAEYLAAYFAEHGIPARVQPIDEKHANVIAWIEGRQEDDFLLWNGHLDTVPYGAEESWHTDPSQPVEQEGRIYARGASDMKSGLAAMVYALCHLPAQAARNILFIGTCDEEKDGLGAETVVKEGMMNKKPLFLLVGEPTGMQVGLAHKGCLWLELEVRGRTSHGAYPDQGVNAVECGMRIAGAVQKKAGEYRHALLGPATAQVTRIEGGVANNMTPDHCRIVMDIRLVPPLTTEDILRMVAEAAEAEADFGNGLSVETHVLNDRRPIEIDHDHAEVAALRTLLQEAGYPGDDIGINFFTDASALDRKGEMDICLFGPGEPALAHKPDEYAEIRKYLDAIGVLQKLAV